MSSSDEQWEIDQRENESRLERQEERDQRDQERRDRENQ